MSQDLYTLDKAGQYNLTELKIISYQESNNPRQDKFKSLDIIFERAPFPDAAGPSIVIVLFFLFIRFYINT